MRILEYADMRFFKCGNLIKTELIIQLPSAFPPPCRNMFYKGLFSRSWPNSNQKYNENNRKWRFGGVPEALGRGLGAFLALRAVQDSKKRFVDHPLRLPKVAQRVQNRAKINQKSYQKSNDF
jgi:hypothetical protein